MENVAISQKNHQYSSFDPQINFITPSTLTSIDSSVRTISGTSANGNEISFLDQGYEPATLFQTTFFPTPRLIASTINEDKLDILPETKVYSNLTLICQLSMRKFITCDRYEECDIYLW